MSTKSGSNRVMLAFQQLGVSKGIETTTENVVAPRERYAAALRSKKRESLLTPRREKLMGRLKARGESQASGSKADLSRQAMEDAQDAGGPAVHAIKEEPEEEVGDGDSRPTPGDDEVTPQ